MTTIAPLTEPEFPAFLEFATVTYADQNVLGGRWRAEDALTLARAETERLLPAGIATPDHHVYGVRANDDGPIVGYVWFTEMQRGSARIAFVVQALIAPEHRRRGHARAALEAVQAIAESMGLSGMALHVFAHNEGARGLYASLGYEVSSLNLVKPLSRRGP